MLFSVILRTFNRPDFLKQSLLSVYMQSHKEWEIIIFDDGGSLESFSIFSKFKELNPENRIVYITSKTPRGFYRDSWKDCFSLSMGDLIIRLDDDDLLTKDSLFELNQIYLEHPRLDFSYGSSFRFEENNLIGSQISSTPIEHPPTRSIWAGYIQGHPYNSPWTFYDNFYDEPRHFTSIIHASKSNYLCVFHPFVFRKSTVQPFVNKIEITSNYVDDLEFTGSLDYLGLCHTSIKRKLIYYRHHNLDRVSSDSSIFQDILRIRDLVDENFRTDNFQSNVYPNFIHGNNQSSEITEEENNEFLQFIQELEKNLEIFNS